jgi:predicted kinase
MMSPERPTPLLVAMRGMPGIGKSVLARAISLEFGWPVLDKDDIKDAVYGGAEAPDRLAYDLQFRLARCQLQQGLSVVCDSPMLHPGVYALAAQAPMQRAPGSSSSSASSATRPSIDGA